MKILLLGGGGREHALAWKIAQSEKCEKLFIAPGNAGTQNVGENVDIKADDFEALKNFTVENGVDMVVVGPEDPLVKGVYDDFKNDPRTQNIPVIGPSKAGAVLEGSKDFAKKFMKRHNIPTAQYETFDGEHVEEGLKFLETLKAPYVLKADGLCAGKGVLILPTLEEAKKEFKEMLGGMFGNASARVVIEEFLSGIECSVFVLTDGKNYKILPEAKDYKRIGEHDTGLNTGGMGTVAPNPYYTPAMAERCMEEIFLPTIRAMEAEGCPFHGCLYFGLMLTPNGPKVIEYNCRFGDPETQVVLPLLESDLLKIMRATTDETLADVEVKFSTGAAACVILASGGYPVAYEKNKEISGLENGQLAQPMDGVTVYHSGTAQKDGKLVTAGGRVLGVSATAEDLPAALKKAYAACETIHFEKMHKRTDIGARALKALEAQNV